MKPSFGPNGNEYEIRESRVHTLFCCIHIHSVFPECCRAHRKQWSDTCSFLSPLIRPYSFGAFLIIWILLRPQSTVMNASGSRYRVNAKRNRTKTKNGCLRRNDSEKLWTRNAKIARFSFAFSVCGHWPLYVVGANLILMQFSLIKI